MLPETVLQDMLLRLGGYFRTFFKLYLDFELFPARMGHRTFLTDLVNPLVAPVDVPELSFPDFSFLILLKVGVQCCIFLLKEL